MIILKKKAIYATFLVLLFIVGVTAQTVSASPANIDSQMVVFNCGAMGKGFVIWDGYPADPPMPDAYFENTFKGFVSFMGSALVEGPTDGWYVAEKPKSIQSRGVLVVEWRHKGIKYELNIDYHSTKRTSGLFNPQIDSFVVPNPDTPGLPIPGISPKLGFLSYKGLLTEEKGNAYTRRQISGDATLTVYKNIDIYRLYFIFELELEDGTSIPVTLGWLNQDLTGGQFHIHRANLFYNYVDLETQVP